MGSARGAHKQRANKHEDRKEMGGGFMADNKDMTMLQQKQQQNSLLHRLLPSHAPAASPNSATTHFSSQAALSAASALTPPSAPSPSLSLLHKRKIPDPLSNTTTTRSSPPPRPCSSNISKQHKKKLLKVILKVPNSTSPPPSSPPLSPHHHSRLTPRSSSSSSPSPSPSPSPPPQHQQLLLQHLQQQAHLKHRQQLTAELQQYHYQQQQQRLSKPPQHPKQLQQQIKHPTQDTTKHQRQHLPKKPHHLQQSQLQEDQSNPNRPNLQQQPEQPNSNRQQHQVQQPNPGRIKLQRQQEEQPNLNRIKLQQQEEQANPSRSKRQEQQQQEEQANLNGPKSQHEQQEEQHTSAYPKRLKLHHQNQQEQTNQALASPKIQTQQHKLPLSHQISSEPVKKLPQNSIQGPHGVHQSPKIPPLPTPCPRHNPFLPSIPAPVQSPPSLSAAPSSAISDEAQKPSKKRKLRSLGDSGSTESHVVVNSNKELQNDSLPQSDARPGLMSAAEAPVLKPHLESKVSKDPAAACISPKLSAVDSRWPQFVPAKKLLRGILDRLQKKDKFGVFAEPVDPNEVPNYYDIIKDPMDFGTMRNRIVSGHYTSLALFERDIFMICNNAMKYNGKGTVYFRHARAIRDVAERIMEDLKTSGLTLEMDEVMPKQKNGGPFAKKSHKKQIVTRPWVERVALDHASGVTLASGCDSGGKASIAGLPESSGRIFERHGSSIYTGSPSETRTDNQEDISGYLLRTMGLNDGRRFQALDENRRSTYMPSSVSAQGSESLMTTISGESLHFVPTGYQLDFPYARSLARFAADLGPSIWKVAAEKIRRALPPGFPFGPGWVGERESPGGIFLAPSSKQQSQVQSSVQSMVNLPNESRSLVFTSNSPVNQESLTKLDHQSRIQSSVQPMVKLPNENRSLITTGNSPVNQESLTKLDHQSRMQSIVQPTVKLPNESRPLISTGNFLANQESFTKLDHQSHMQSSVQPMVKLPSSYENRPLIKGDSPVIRESLVKLDQSRGAAGNGSNTATPMNLNHPASLQPETVRSTEDSVLNRDNLLKGKEDRALNKENLSKVNLSGPIPGMVSSAAVVTNTGCPQFEGNFLNKGSVYVSVGSQMDRVNSLNASSGDANYNAAFGMKDAAPNQFESRAPAQMNRSKSLNGNLSGEASSNVAVNVKYNSSHHFNNIHSARGPTPPHNLNVPAQHSSASSHMGTGEAYPVDSGQPNSSLHHGNIPSTRGAIPPCSLNVPTQHSGSSHVGAREVNLVESGQSKQVPPPCIERASSVNFREASERHEVEMLNRRSRGSSSMAAVVAKKGLNVGRSSIMQELEARNSEGRQVPDRDQFNASIRNLDRSNEKTNSTVGPSSVSLSVLPSSNGASRVREDQRMPGWVPAQQPDLVSIAGNGGMKMQSQVPRSSVHSQQVQSAQYAQSQNPHLRLASIQQQGFQDGQVYPYGNQKHIPNVPHFLLQQQLNNDSHSSIQQQQQLQLQSNSIPATAQFAGASESWDPKLVRHRQVPGHLTPGIPQSGNQTWQYMSPQMVLQQGSNLPFSAPPDLNVTLPSAKSPFDQSNGSEIQQPDLALQL